MRTRGGHRHGRGTKAGALGVAAGLLWALALVAVQPATAHSGYYVTKWSDPGNVKWGFTPSVPTGAWRDRTLSAAGAWNRVGTKMKFAKGSDFSTNFAHGRCPSSPGVNGVHRKWLGGAGGTLAKSVVCIYSSTPSRLWSFQVVYDKSERWYTGTGSPRSGQYDLQSIGTHEFGHATGFGMGSAPDHLPGGASICANKWGQHTMCPKHYAGTNRQRTLETHDKDGFVAAY